MMDTDRLRVLVLGATGMLGHRLVQVLADRYEVHGTVRDLSRARRFALPAHLHELDACAPAALSELLETTAPAAAVNCVGLVKQRREASEPIPAVTVNALFPHQLARACEDTGVRLVHVSTDCVFSGDLPAPARYTEEDVADARDLYGRTKLLGELAEPALTVRTSIIGWELERATGLLEWFAAQRGETVRGFTNAIFSGLTTTALSDTIAALIEDHPGLSGLYHVSVDPISKFDLLVALRERLGLPCEVVPVEEPRINRALDVSRFRARTGIEPPSWSTMLAEYEREIADVGS